jgi:hypothetical protein
MIGLWVADVSLMGSDAHWLSEQPRFVETASPTGGLSRALRNAYDELLVSVGRSNHRVT